MSLFCVPENSSALSKNVAVEDIILQPKKSHATLSSED